MELLVSREHLVAFPSVEVAGSFIVACMAIMVGVTLFVGIEKSLMKRVAGLTISFLFVSVSFVHLQSFCFSSYCSIKYTFSRTVPTLCTS